MTPPSLPLQNHSINYRAVFICTLVGLLLWFCPRSGILLEDKAWHILSLFITTILGLIIKPLPMGATALVVMVIAIVTKTITLEMALTGFSNENVWLIVFALFIANGFSVTGLGKRIAYYFTSLLGKSSLGLAYGMLMTDLMLAPAIPSVTGRIGGIVFPILKSISTSYQSLPFSQSSKKIGGFLTLVSFQGCAITSALFLTAMGANPMLQAITNAQITQNQWAMPEITWGLWAIATLVPGLVSLILMPLFVYLIYPPEIKHTPNAPVIAHEQLQILGKMKANEWIMVGTVILLLVLWIFGKQLHLPAVLSAMIGVCILILARIIDWRALVKIDEAWETFVWFCILMMFAKTMLDYGVITWVSQLIQAQLGGYSWKIAFPLLALVYFYSHYFFASATAHVLSMYGSFLTISVALGTPPMLAALALIFTSSLYGGLTHYSFAPAPLLYSAGYLDIKDWWKAGFLVSLLNIAIWGTIGLAWWKFLGYW